jgi:hypothetical protein
VCVDIKAKLGKEQEAAASFMARGRVYLKCKRYTEAVADFTKCLQFNLNYFKGNCLDVLMFCSLWCGADCNPLRALCLAVRFASCYSQPTANAPSLTAN